MYAAKILADSISPGGSRLTTFELTYPRIIHAEIMTHRVFSRNSASSRAIPLKKQIEKVKAQPFVPEKWPKEQKGMTGGEGLKESWMESKAREAWLKARDDAIDMAERMSGLGVHKAIASRLLEPFMWHTIILTGTEFDNFFALRSPEKKVDFDFPSQPEMQKIALAMRSLYEENTPVKLEVGEWHLPFVTAEEKKIYTLPYQKKVSTGRCARISYLTHDGYREPDKDFELHDRLLNDGHMSPFEHIATPLKIEGFVFDRFCKNFRGWKSYRDEIPYEDNYKEKLRVDLTENAFTAGVSELTSQGVASN